MKFISPRTDIPLLLSYFMVAGCQAPLELDTHQIKSTTSDFECKRPITRYIEKVPKSCRLW
ncbi:hypothetical protein, partial [Streptococcus suis]|uniref:hypothetical protein n=1 Tax=Streptococcus suis TaxID=1307 RepID=UPI0005CCC408